MFFTKIASKIGAKMSTGMIRELAQPSLLDERDGHYGRERLGTQCRRVGSRHRRVRSGMTPMKIVISRSSRSSRSVLVGIVDRRGLVMRDCSSCFMQGNAFAAAERAKEQHRRLQIAQPPNLL